MYGRALDPPFTAPTWPIVPNDNFLVTGVGRNLHHVQIPAQVGGNSPDPMQRLGMAPMSALGMLPPDTNEAGVGIGSRYPASESRLLAPVPTIWGGAALQALPPGFSPGTPMTR